MDETEFSPSGLSTFLHSSETLFEMCVAQCDNLVSGVCSGLFFVYFRADVSQWAFGAYIFES